jgi:hypothetical protein
MFNYMVRTGLIKPFISAVLGTIGGKILGSAAGKAVAGTASKLVGSAAAKTVMGRIATDGISTGLKAMQANKQMRFQRDMSNTSYQRAMDDMRAAGINPALAISQGGASTPGGAGYNPDLTNPIPEAQTAKNLEYIVKQNKVKLEADEAATAVEVAKDKYILKNQIPEAAIAKAYGSSINSAKGQAIIKAQKLLNDIKNGNYTPESKTKKLSKIFTKPSGVFTPPNAGGLKGRY